MKLWWGATYDIWVTFGFIIAVYFVGWLVFG